MKECSKCKETKDLTEFGKDKRAKDGRHSWCKNCLRQYSKQYREDNKEYWKQYREDNKEKQEQYQKQYKEDNKESIQQYQKQYQKKYQKQYLKNNPEKNRAYRRKRRALKKELQENFTPAMEQITRTSFGDKCFNCSAEDNLCIDHHKPLSKGYALGLDNAVLLCKSCNSSKSNKMPAEFYSEQQLEDLETYFRVQRDLYSLDVILGIVSWNEKQVAN